MSCAPAIENECWVVFEATSRGELLLHSGDGKPPYKLPRSVARAVWQLSLSEAQCDARKPYRDVISKHLEMINELRWNNDTKDVSRTHAAVSELEREIQKLRKERDEFAPKLHLEQQRCIKLLERNTELEKELVVFALEKDTAESRRSSAQSGILEQLKATQREREELRTKEIHLRAQVLELQSQLAQRDSQLDFARFELEKQITSLQDELQHRSDQTTSLRRQLEQAELEARQRVESTRLIFVDKLEQDARTIRVQAQEIVSLKEEVRNSQKFSAQQQCGVLSQLDSVQASLTEERERTRQLSAQVEESEFHVRQLENEMNDLQGELVRTRMRAERESERLRQTINQMAAELSHEKEAAVAAFQNQLEALKQQEIAKLKSVHDAEMNERNAKLTSVEQQLANLRKAKADRVDVGIQTSLMQTLPPAIAPEPENRNVIIAPSSDRSQQEVIAPRLHVTPAVPPNEARTFETASSETILQTPKASITREPASVSRPLSYTPFSHPPVVVPSIWPAEDAPITLPLPSQFEVHQYPPGTRPPAAGSHNGPFGYPPGTTPISPAGIQHAKAPSAGSVPAYPSSLQPPPRVKIQSP
eukprot:TRINITY_DN1241_c0_g1_i1.p1 TRINITY_DN1241_c0_g1~~TRINITY_DN1241_c0_g1_i1.p1  ORF type:complete len:659 (+),score=112.61 TRINITY_DN1241_c0_g1_i1:206-1978(+)